MLNHEIIQEWGEQLKEVIENAVLFSWKSLSTIQKRDYFCRNYQLKNKRKMNDLVSEKNKIDEFNQ